MVSLFCMLRFPIADSDGRNKKGAHFTSFNAKCHYCFQSQCHKVVERLKHRDLMVIAKTRKGRFVA